jgi:hypothetical protein
MSPRPFFFVIVAFFSVASVAHDKGIKHEFSEVTTERKRDPAGGQGRQARRRAGPVRVVRNHQPRRVGAPRGTAQAYKLRLVV